MDDANIVIEQISEINIQRLIIDLSKKYLRLREQNIVSVDDFAFIYLNSLTELISIKESNLIKKWKKYLAVMNDNEKKIYNYIVKKDKNYGSLCQQLNYIYNLIFNKELRENFAFNILKKYEKNNKNISDIDIPKSLDSNYLPFH